MNFKGKTVGEAITKALKSLNLTEDELDITIIQKPVKGLLGLIGNKEAKIEVAFKETLISSLSEGDKLMEKKSVRIVVNDNKTPLTKEDRQRKIDKGTGFLKEVLNALEYPVECFISDEEEFVKIDIRGESVGNLIGKRGETLYAFQYLVNLAANRNDDNSLKFIVDIEDFRKRREKILDALANRLAKKVIETKNPVSLEPMNPLERKLIHMSLQENEFVTTISEGSEGQRYVKIILKETRR